jgi:hypothetical protein
MNTLLFGAKTPNKETATSVRSNPIFQSSPYDENSPLFLARRDPPSTSSFVATALGHAHPVAGLPVEAMTPSSLRSEDEEMDYGDHPPQDQNIAATPQNPPAINHPNNNNNNNNSNNNLLCVVGGDASPKTPVQLVSSGIPSYEQMHPKSAKKTPKKAVNDMEDE